MHGSNDIVSHEDYSYFHNGSQWFKGGLKICMVVIGGQWFKGGLKICMVVMILSVMRTTATFIMVVSPAVLDNDVLPHVGNVSVGTIVVPVGSEFRPLQFGKLEDFGGLL